MSKASLKKELRTLTSDQLVEVIMNAYSSSKEAKEYFEFFLNPDVAGLFDKKKEIIQKEFKRSKYGYSKARISYIKTAIKDFASFGIDPAYVGDLMLYAIRLAVAMERFYNFSATLGRGVLKLTEDYIKLMVENHMVKDAAENIANLSKESDLGRKVFRDSIVVRAQNTFNELSHNFTQI